MPFSWKLQQLAIAVTVAGGLVKDAMARGVKVTVKEGQPGGSHHSIGTEADEESQTFLLDQLRSRFPGAYFIAEEECKGPDLIKNDNLALVKGPGEVLIVDAVDGTAGAYRGRWDWSVVLNRVENGEHQGGAICAPDVRGGFLVLGAKGDGVFLRDGVPGSGFQPVRVVERPRQKSTVLFGVDVLKRPQFMRFGNRVANAVETVVTAGSCGLGVALVAAGRAEAIVQPHQWPWDWASAEIIRAAGGTVQYYHYRNGTIAALAEPDLASYHRSNRTTEGGLGFIAGAPELVDWLFERLKATFVLEGTALPGV
ncbi:MAG: hypothetical protein HY983_00375 [Candidatus Magasanikbacteria bacterium]|nr:hypothetical protein [Candidatus Magasanikbacteria bacterium]